MKIDYNLTENFKTNVLNFALNCDLQLGAQWYPQRQKELIGWLVSEKIPLNYVVFMAVVSILSPANKWESNVNDAKTLVLRFYGLPNDRTYKYYTYNNNVTKALNLLTSYNDLQDKVDAYKFSLSYFGKTGLKTMNFFKNLVDPSKPYITIDRHMLKTLGLTTKSVTPKQYEYFTDIFIDVHHYLVKEGIFNGTLSSFQAVLWCNYVYNIHGIKH